MKQDLEKFQKESTAVIASFSDAIARVASSASPNKGQTTHLLQASLANSLVLLSASLANSVQHVGSLANNVGAFRKRIKKNLTKTLKAY